MGTATRWSQRYLQAQLLVHSSSSEAIEGPNLHRQIWETERPQGIRLFAQPFIQRMLRNLYYVPEVGRWQPGY